jgi:cysteine desulfurase
MDFFYNICTFMPFYGRLKVIMSKNSIVYLDNSATTQVCTESAQIAAEVMTIHYGNPSSNHAMGMQAEKIIVSAKQSISHAIGCNTDEVFFTSGGTEANNLAIFGTVNALKRRGKRIITTQIEHSSVLQAINELEKHGFEVVRLRPSPEGKINEQDIYAAVTKDTIMVSLMLVNNETGSVQPVSAAKKAVKAVDSPALVHCDAVQAFCKMPLALARIGADLISVSAHKIHGPKGVGALYIKNGVRIVPLLYGGGQQKGIRPGTESVPFIAAFGTATDIAFKNMQVFTKQAVELKAFLTEKLLDIPEVTINSADDALPFILNFSVNGVKSEVMLNLLSSQGIYLSSGSACSKGKKSYVLTAMGLPHDRIDSALRVSFSRFNTIDDCIQLAEAVARGASTLQKFK